MGDIAKRANSDTVSPIPPEVLNSEKTSVPSTENNIKNVEDIDTKEWILLYFMLITKIIIFDEAFMKSHFNCYN